MSAQRVGYTGKGQNSVMGKGDSVTKKVWIEVDIEKWGEIFYGWGPQPLRSNA